MKRILMAFCAAAALVQSTLAAPLTFDFKDPKGVNSASFKLDAPLEAVNGSANGITGTVTYDPANPATASGNIVVTTASLHVPNPTMDGHLHSAMWLDATKYPEVKFATSNLSNVVVNGDAVSADAHGTITIKGTSKEMTIPVKINYLKGKLSQRVPNLNGDLLVLRARFTVKRSDFGIQAHQMEDKVSDEIEITLSIAGASTGG